MQTDLTIKGTIPAELVLEDFQPEFAIHFERLNKAWLNKYFVVEPIDEYVLTHPEEALLNDGGAILFARYGKDIIGTVGLKNLGNNVMELTKMAVDERFQGLGAGKFLCRNAIEQAKEMKVEKLLLYSQTKLETALAIYRKNGFVDIPLEPGKYKRADVMMELVL